MRCAGRDWGKASARYHALVPTWAANAIVGVVFLVIAVVVVLIARRQMRTPPIAPEQQRRTLKEDVEWAKQQIRGEVSVIADRSTAARFSGTQGICSDHSRQQATVSHSARSAASPTGGTTPRSRSSAS
jgi:putative superfamily III holin-X